MFDCPRRLSDRGSANQVDYWRTEQNGLRTCSYDGSLHPEDFLKFVTEKAEIGPTDKSYKFYIHAADESVAGAGKFYTHHFSMDLSWGDEFARLFEAGEINWGYPGHAYVSLYVPRTNSKAVPGHVIKGEENA